MKRALFFINSISNGGAERVCVNLTKRMIEEGYKVDYIILGENEENKNKYLLDENVEILNLNVNHKNKLIKVLKTLLAVKKVNNYISKKEKEDRYNIITSHLPISNLLTRLSKVNKRAIYVFHINMSYYCNEKNNFLKFFIKKFFNKRKVVTVSKGIMNECIYKFGFDKNYIYTIYNPINFEEIDKLKKEKIDIDEKYLLQVGRFSNQKRQDRMLKIFKKGEFYKKYKLVFCGTGSNEEYIKKLAKEMNIDKYIIFKGWQSNIYKWITNAELLICSSDNEGFPMNLIEASYCGTKVVSADCDFGPNEILIGNYKKFLVKDKDNINEYIEKINDALKGYPKEENEVIKLCEATNVIKEYEKISRI